MPKATKCKKAHLRARRERPMARRSSSSPRRRAHRKCTSLFDGRVLVQQMRLGGRRMYPFDRALPRRRKSLKNYISRRGMGLLPGVLRSSERTGRGRGVAGRRPSRADREDQACRTHRLTRSPRKDGPAAELRRDKGEGHARARRIRAGDEDPPCSRVGRPRNEAEGEALREEVGGNERRAKMTTEAGRRSRRRDVRADERGMRKRTPAGLAIRGRVEVGEQATKRLQLW